PLRDENIRLNPKGVVRIRSGSRQDFPRFKCETRNSGKSRYQSKGRYQSNFWLAHSRAACVARFAECDMPAG
ncbi:MAG: hypothetical protein ACOVLE_00985, partial [Pirellula staleyi]